jgi:enoyl-CoA hydratase
MTSLVRYAVDDHAVALPDALSALCSQLALAFTTEDIVEGAAAFREKRQPVWKMR